MKGYTDSGGVWQDVLPHKSWGTSAKDRWDWSWQKVRSCAHFLWWFLAPSGPEHFLWDFEPCKGDMSLRLVSLDDVCCWTCVIPQRDLSFICLDEEHKPSCQYREIWPCQITCQTSSEPSSYESISSIAHCLAKRFEDSAAYKKTPNDQLENNHQAPWNTFLPVGKDLFLGSSGNVMASFKWLDEKIKAKTSHGVLWDEGEFNIGINWSTVWMCRIYALCLPRRLLFFVLALPCQSAYDAILGSSQYKRKYRFVSGLCHVKSAVHRMFIVFSHFMNRFNSYRGLSALPLLVSMGPARECCVVGHFGTQPSKMFQSDDRGRRKEWEDLVWLDRYR